MKLAEAIEQGLRRNKKYDCAVQTLINSIDEDDARALQTALGQLSDRSANFSVSWLHRTLIEQGYKIGASTLSRHINGGCACESQ